MTSSNFDVMSDNLRRHESVNRDDFILTLCQSISFHRAYLLVKFYDDRRSRTCWTKSQVILNRPSTGIAVFLRLWRHHSTTQSQLFIKLGRIEHIFHVKIKSFYKFYDTSCSQKLQNDVKIRHWWRHRYVNNVRYALILFEWLQRV